MILSSKTYIDLERERRFEQIDKIKQVVSEMGKATGKEPREFLIHCFWR